MKIAQSVEEKQKNAPKKGCLETVTAKYNLRYNILYTLPFTSLPQSLPVCGLLLLVIFLMDVTQQRDPLIFPDHHLLVSALRHFVFLNFQQR